MDNAIADQAIKLLNGHDSNPDPLLCRWELELGCMDSSRFYATLSRWGMAKTGTRRSRKFFSGFGNTINEATLHASERVLKWAEAKHA